MLRGQQQMGQAKEPWLAHLERREVQVRRVRRRDWGWEKEEHEARVQAWAPGPPGRA